ncbi:hypothetical protein K3495_g9805 [Podosphaera aphanis]|nr:hypothetical protein K3495_g9805 [Podosphaera aphanis]
MPTLCVGFQLVVGFITLINTSFVTSHPNIIRTSLEANEGYRCDRRAYNREFLIQSALQASRRLFGDISLNSIVDDTSFPKPYKGPIDFGQKNLFLWPLSEGGHSSSNAETHFLVLGDYVKNIVGVVRGQETQHVKCIKEYDFSDMYDSQIVAGYRCPLDIYPVETIRKQIENAKFYAQERMPTFEIHLKFVDGPQIYHDIDKSWIWSITGKNHLRATSSIILDENFSLIGMVHLRKGIYTRCLITAKNEITPKFVGEAILQPAESVNQEHVDIFQCGPTSFIYSDQVLKAASAANRRFIQTRKDKSHSSYPSPYQRPSGNDDLFLWPMRVNSNGKYVESAKFDKNEKFYVIIDYFSDVHGLIIKYSAGVNHECQRKLYPRRHVTESLIWSNSFISAKRIKTN